MKNLLFINGHLNVGGCERSLVDVLKHIDYDKYHVDLLLLEELGDYLNEIPEKVNICLYSLKGTEGSFFGCLKSAVKQRDWFSFGYRLIHTLSSKISPVFLRLLRPFFRKLSSYYDVVIAYRPGICTELAAYTIKGKRKVSWWHHGEMLYTGKQVIALKKEYSKMDQIVAVSESSAKMLVSCFPEIADKVCIIPNMICVEELKQKTNCYQVERSENELTLVSVGRMSPEKNFLLCPEIGKELVRKGIRYKWYIVGDGVQYEEMKQTIEKYGLSDQIVLTGRLQNPYPYIAFSDFLIHPSLVESQGITILESIALGTPVIVAKSEGPKEFIQDGKNGFLVAPDAEAISTLIYNLQANECRYNEIKKNANCPEQFFPEQVMDKIYKLME